MTTSMISILAEELRNPELPGIYRDLAPVLERAAEKAHDAVEQMRARKDAAYRERNACVALIAHMALSLGWRAGIGQHEDKPGEDWDPEWRTLVTIDLPTGQASWHFHNSHKHMLEGLPSYSGSWDGHDTPTKYARLARFKYKQQQPMHGAKGVLHWKSELADALLERDKARAETEMFRRQLSGERVACRELQSELSQALRKIATLERQRNEAKQDSRYLLDLKDEISRLRSYIDGRADELSQAELAAKVLADELEAERANVAELETRNLKLAGKASGLEFVLAEARANIAKLELETERAHRKGIRMGLLKAADECEGYSAVVADDPDDLDKDGPHAVHVSVARKLASDLRKIADQAGAKDA